MIKTPQGPGFLIFFQTVYKEVEEAEMVGGSGGDYGGQPSWRKKVKRKDEQDIMEVMTAIIVTRLFDE